MRSKYSRGFRFAVLALEIWKRRVAVLPFTSSPLLFKKSFMTLSLSVSVYIEKFFSYPILSPSYLRILAQKEWNVLVHT